MSSVTHPIVRLAPALLTLAMAVLLPELGSAQVRPPASKPRRTPPTNDRPATDDRPTAGNRPAANDRPATDNRRPQGPATPPRAPRAPFTLSPEEEAELDRTLLAWEESSAKIRKLRADFIRWEYDAVFGKRDAEGNIEPTESRGEVYFTAPDKGTYKVTSEGGEHWICTGSSIFEYNAQKKQVIERVLPPELKGRAISESPLPFLFGADARRQKQRYFLRIVTPEGVEGQVWLEAQPRYAADAANFMRATVILDQKELLPTALEVILPNGKNKTVHQFEKRVVNAQLSLGELWKNPFSPSLPRGWTRVVENAAPAAEQEPARQPAPATTRRPAPRGQESIPR
jgi:TIGR03009 family protein